MTIFASYPYASQSWLQMGCARDFSASKVYREIVPTAPPTSSSSTSSSTSTSRPATTGATATTPPGPTSSTPAPPPAAATTSQAWIAGAVIGVVVAVGALAFLAFWFGRRRGRKTSGVVAVGPSASTLAIMAPGKSYAPSSLEPDRGSYVEVPGAAGGGYPMQPQQQGYYGGHTSPPPGQYPGGYAAGGSPGYYQRGGAYDQSGQGRAEGYYQPPPGVEELPARTPVGKFEPWKRSELDG